MDYVRVVTCSAPTLNWDAMLDMPKVEFELISEADIY